MIISPNTIETPRLLLRPFVASDVPAYARIRGKPSVIKFLAGGTANLAQAPAVAERTVTNFISLWEGESGYGPWAIIERESGTLLGHMGLRKLPELQDQTELLYLLDDDFWGRGFATEGALSSLAYGFDILRLRRIIAMAMPENSASLKLMARVGMSPAPSLIKAFGLDVVEYSLTIEDWLSRNQS